MCMMNFPSFFVALVYVSGYMFLLFAAVCLACGLFYLAELAEEYSTLTKKVLRGMILAQLGVFFMLWAYEGFSFVNCAIGFGAHVIYYQLLRTFPFMEPKSPQFILAVVAFLISNVTWHWHFRTHYDLFYDYRLSPTPSIASFFLICVWMVPAGFFISLTVNDSVLPGAGIDRPSSSSASLPTGDLDSKQKKTRNLVAASVRNITYYFKKLTGRPDRDTQNAFRNL